ncbi:MAG TPA: hypothetical protein VKE27_01175 [Candidatus Dormibacteraeota bacterium]|nr:hypothetical protein [Candidatus Dormibacteraeota bacterium]
MAAAASLLLPAAAVACTPQTCGGPDQGISLSVASINAVEGSQVGPEIATLVDSDPTATPGQYTASINWGDGSPPVNPTIVSTATPGHFILEATHQYADAGDYFVGIGVRDVDNFFTRASGNTTAHIAEAPISVYGITDALGNPYCDAVATIVDPNPARFAADYTANIDWGDGTSSAGTVVPNDFGGPGTQGFAIQGCHTYADLGPHPLTTTISDGALQMAATSTAWVYADTEGGTFAIGDGNATIGSSVTFWGARWATANTLSGGAAPGDFKGFAPGRSPICVGSWTAHPGDSAAAPSALPGYTAVLVSSSISQDGGQITGNSIHVALVRTNAGYGPSLDAPGAGTVVFMIC